MAEGKPRMTVDVAEAASADEFAAASMPEFASDSAPQPMSTRESVPASEEDSAPEPVPEVAPEPAPNRKESVLSAATAWVSRTFPGHENAFWGGIAGFAVAILIFAIGILRTLVIALLILAGVATGQAIDGDPKIVNAIRTFIDSRNS